MESGVSNRSSESLIRTGQIRPKVLECRYWKLSSSKNQKMPLQGLEGKRCTDMLQIKISFKFTELEEWKKGATNWLRFS